MSPCTIMRFRVSERMPSYLATNIDRPVSARVQSQFTRYNSLKGCDSVVYLPSCKNLYKRINSSLDFMVPSSIHFRTKIFRREGAKGFVETFCRD